MQEKVDSGALVRAEGMAAGMGPEETSQHASAGRGLVNTDPGLDHRKSVFGCVCACECMCVCVYVCRWGYVKDCLV